MPKPMMVLQAIITGPLAFCAALSARNTSAASWPSHASVIQPAAWKRSIMLVDSDSEVDAVDGDRIVVPQHDQIVELEMAGQRDRFVADAFLQIAVAGDHIDLVIDQILAEAGIEMALPPAPCPPHWRCPGPSGPVVVSMPGAWPYSGWPAVRLPTLAETLQLIDRHVRIAGEIEQRIEQHRAMAGRQHETVAVGPVRDAAGSNFRKRENRTVAASAMPMGRPGWPDLAFSTASMESMRMTLARRRV